MNKKKSLIIIIILFLVLIIASIISITNHNNKKVELGDQVALFNRIDEKGKEVESVVAVYNQDFTKEKLIIKLDDIFYSIDQLNWSKSEGIDENVKFRAYNNHSYQDITLNLNDGSVEKSNVINKKYSGDEKVELNVYDDGKFELVKPDSYMLIKDPNLTINNQYYSLSDYTQFTNYEIQR